MILWNYVSKNVRCVKVQRRGGGKGEEIDTNETSETSGARVDTCAGGAAHPLPVLAAAAQGGCAH